MGRPVAPGILTLVVAMAALAPAAAGEQSADALFDRTAVRDVRLFLHSKDWQSLKDHHLENTYYAADVQLLGQRVRNVGIRSRGSASRSATKPGLQIAFDRYVSGQRAFGLRGLVLDNLWQDASMIREWAAMELFARMGHLAPRQAFARVFVNDVFYGIYTIVEPVDDLLVARAGGEAGAFVYEFKWTEPYYFQDLGADRDPYKTRFEPRTHTLESDAVLYDPIRELIQEANGPEDAVWRDRTERHLDLGAFVRYLAIETFLSEPDGFLGALGMSNFYLARPRAHGPHRLIPWDKDQSFGEVEAPLFLRVDENVLARRALAFDDLRGHYLDHLEAAARLALTERWLAAEIERGIAIVQELAAVDGLKPYTLEQVEEAFAFVRRFAVERPRFVLEEVEKARQR